MKASYPVNSGVCKITSLMDLKYHRYGKVKNNNITNVKKSHKLVKVKLTDNDIKTNSNGFDIIIGKAAIKVETVGNSDAVARLNNLINEA